MSNSANTFTSLQPMMKEVYSNGKKSKKELNYKKYGFKKLKGKIKKKKES